VSLSAAETRFLIPIFARPMNGAFGSVWEVQTWMYYTGQEWLYVSPPPFCGPVLCGSHGVIEPGWSPFVVQQPLAGYPNGVLLHVNEAHSHEVSFEARFRDRSRLDATAGTELPVVREDAFRNAPVALLNVPRSLNYRTTLRVYALPEADDRRVRVNLYSVPIQSGSTLDVRKILRRSELLTLTTPSNPSLDARVHPAFALLSKIEHMPEVAGENAIWIEVVPVGDARVWAFASLTDNDTQQVTIVSPKP
jgi:hypothetical protein